jgi:CheY-like chemotaxis protein
MMHVPLTTILIVDDDEEDIFATQRILRKSGVTAEFRTANSGEALMDYLAQIETSSEGSFPTSDMILLDINIPRMTGFELLRHLKTDACYSRYRWSCWAFRISPTTLPPVSSWVRRRMFPSLFARTMCGNCWLRSGASVM